MKRLPKLSIHKASSRYYIRLEGHCYYLGRADGTAEAEATAEKERLRILGEYQAGARARTVRSARTSISMLASAYLDHVDRRYRKPDGTPSSESRCIDQALRPLLELYGPTLVSEFGAEQLEALQLAMASGSWLTEEEKKDPRRKRASRGWCRNLVNANTRRMQRMFRWGVTRDLVPPDQEAKLSKVPGLRAGQCGVRETAKVPPAPEDSIEVVRGRVSHVVRAMIDMQMLTAARPGEVCTMRGREIDRTGVLASRLLGMTVDPGRVWVYLPGLDLTTLSQEHKMAHIESRAVKIILIGLKAQEVLKPFLEDRSPDAYLFSPAESEAARDAARRATRKTPMTPSQAARKPKENPQRAPHDHYHVGSYAHAIAAACRGRRAKPQGNRRPAFSEIPAVTHWHPHQLRHLAATNLEREFGLEVARIILGHSSFATTLTYVQADLQKAIRAMEKFG